jgi:hypothetical protein
MNPLETIPIMAIRRELIVTCKKMILLARKPSKNKGYDQYDIENEEYQRLAKTRDYLCEALRKEWNRTTA